VILFPPCSQALDVDSCSILLRTSDFYQQLEVEVWTQKEVRGEGKKNPDDAFSKVSEENRFLF